MNILPYAPQDWPEVCRIHGAARRDELTAAGLIATYLTLEETAENEGFHEYEIRVAEVDGLLVGFVAFTDDELGYTSSPPHTAKGSEQHSFRLPLRRRRHR